MSLAINSRGPLQTKDPSGITPKTKARPPPPPFILPLNIAFYICLISHLLAASNAPIQDCDETFNYWEPLHYLTHGAGLQTWEYSPEFGIRSWAYILIHAIPTKIVSLVGKSRAFEFYSLRCLLAFVCAATETRLYSAISRTLNARIGVFYLMIVAFTPGIFYASTAFLPSTFTMYTSTLGLTAFMDWQGSPKTATAIMWFGVGALLGWPFAGALIIPFVLEDWAVAIVTGDWYNTFLRYLDGTVRCLIILGLQVGIDAFFYHQVLVVPWRLVMYNIFSGKERGPGIFGTEPWHFYVRNLLLNFNLWFLLAIIVAPLLAIQAIFLRRKTTNQTLLRTVTFITPFYLWFAIFTLQPHKEERFMYPAYPFLALSAAIALHMLLSWLGDSNPSTIVGRIPARVKIALILPVILVSINIGLLRIVNTVSSYRAPLQIYDSISSSSNTSIKSDPSTVCLGKDWYRFPSSFHIPPDTRPKFIKSAFTGLLPGPFAEAQHGLGSFPGTWLPAPGMNDRNIEDPGKYTDLSLCEFLVDSQFPSASTGIAKTTASELDLGLEPDFVADTDNWSVVKCVPFLDTVATPMLARTLWVPDWAVVPARFRRVWGRHCLLRAQRSPG